MLGEAERVLPGIPERRAVEQARPRVHHIHHDQPHRAPDRRVRAVALAERIVAAIDRQPARHRAVDDEHHCRSPGAAGRPMVGEVRMAEPFDGGDDDRQVLRAAARHDRVDRHLVGHDHGVAPGDLADNLVAAQAAGSQHLLDRRVARRHHRQAVGPAGAVVGLDELSRVLNRIQGMTMIASGRRAP